MWMCNVAHRGFAHFARFSAYGRKSSRHPPPPNRTSTGMCQKGDKTRDFRPRRPTEPLATSWACSASSSTSSKSTPSTRTTVASRSTTSAEWSRTVGAIRSATLDDLRRVVASTRSVTSTVFPRTTGYTRTAMFDVRAFFPDRSFRTPLPTRLLFFCPPHISSGCASDRTPDSALCVPHTSACRLSTLRDCLP